MSDYVDDSEHATKVRENVEALESEVAARVGEAENDGRGPFAEHVETSKL